MRVVEGVSGTWFYHLTDKDSDAVALCGAQTMHTAAPLSSWGFAGHPGHIRYRYCKECEKLAGIRSPQA